MKLCGFLKSNAPTTELRKICWHCRGSNPDVDMRGKRSHTHRICCKITTIGEISRVISGVSVTLKRNTHKNTQTKKIASLCAIVCFFYFFSFLCLYHVHLFGYWYPLVYKICTMIMMNISNYY